jgi:hypothetical protein
MIRATLTSLFWVGLLWLGVASATAHAQVAQAPRHATRRDVLYLSAGVDASVLTITQGYGHSFPLRVISRDLFLFAEVSFGALRPDPFDLSTRLGARIDLFSVDGFALPIELAAGVAATSNAAFDAIGLETELTLLPGYYADGGSIAIEAAWRQTWTSLVTPSQTYRDLAYADAQDGFYALTASRLRLGARAALVVDRSVEISLRGGYEYLGALGGLIPPFYMTLTFGLIF